MMTGMMSLGACISSGLFPTCQVRVVRFYVSCRLLLLLLLLLVLRLVFLVPNRDHVSSVFLAGPQPRSCELSVPCRTSTAIVWVQCSVPDLHRDPVSSVFRAGPQPRPCEFSVPCRTSTATAVWVQCSVPDLNRVPVSSVFCAGPQPRSCEFSVPCRASTAIMWVQCSVPDLNRDPVSSVFRAGPQPWSCEEICQKECQGICQKECQKICPKEFQKICQKECQNWKPPDVVPRMVTGIYGAWAWQCKVPLKNLHISPGQMVAVEEATGRRRKKRRLT